MPTFSPTPIPVRLQADPMFYIRGATEDTKRALDGALCMLCCAALWLLLCGC
jgi:hypothetical protein